MPEVHGDCDADSTDTIVLRVLIVLIMLIVLIVLVVLMEKRSYVYSIVTHHFVLYPASIPAVFVSGSWLHEECS